MYKQSNILTSFFISGFQYHDGALVIDKLKPGKKLALKAEPDNPYDPCAVAIYRKDVQLGYIPKDENVLISQLLAFGHEKVVECRVMQVNPMADPWHQVRVGLYITDATKKK